MSTITRTTKYASLKRKETGGQAPTRWDTKCWRNVDERTDHTEATKDSLSYKIIKTAYMIQYLERKVTTDKRQEKTVNTKSM